MTGSVGTDQGTGARLNGKRLIGKRLVGTRLVGKPSLIRKRTGKNKADKPAFPASLTLGQRAPANIAQIARGIGLCLGFAAI
jgi:hypothetical protein